MGAREIRVNQVKEILIASLQLGLEEVKNLLGVDTVDGTQRQVERLCRWVERLVETRGKAFVLENRRSLLDQLDQHMKLKTKSCC